MKRKGTGWETECVNFLKSKGWWWAERRTLAGSSDKGDISIAKVPVVIEAKNQNRITLAEWVDETTKETANAGAEVGVCWIKRRGKASAGDGYVVMTGEQFAVILRMLYGENLEQDNP